MSVDTDPLVLGIDPGLSGALAWLRIDGSLIGVADMPVLGGEVSAVGLLDLSNTDVAMVVLEWPGLMPKNGAKSARSMGMSLATVHTWCAAQQLPVTRVAPGTWKRSMHLDSDKTRSTALACRLWPAHQQLFRRVKDADRAEAALLAYWWLTRADGRLLFTGQVGA